MQVALLRQAKASDRAVMLVQALTSGQLLPPRSIADATASSAVRPVALPDPLQVRNSSKVVTATRHSSTVPCACQPMHFCCSICSCSSQLQVRRLLAPAAAHAVEPGKIRHQYQARWAQAHAWVALGKLCLASEALAKRCVPLLVQELRAAPAPAVRNNIMVALADLCIQVPSPVRSATFCTAVVVGMHACTSRCGGMLILLPCPLSCLQRQCHCSLCHASMTFQQSSLCWLLLYLTPGSALQYTALVDAHVPRLAACLGDRHELVRRQALALLANLLQKVRRRRHHPSVPSDNTRRDADNRRNGALRRSQERSVITICQHVALALQLPSRSRCVWMHIDSLADT